MKILKIQKKFIISVPENIKIIYSVKKKIIIFINLKNQKKSLKLKTQIIVNNNLQNLIITAKSFSKISNYKKKKLKIIQGTTLSIIKYILIELSVSFFCQKMKFIGVGYRAFLENKNKKHLIYLRLGYSHQIYFRFINKLNVFCLKFTKLFIFGNSYQSVTQMVALIRSYKVPEPYKGKGILYENEKISLKIGKRI